MTMLASAVDDGVSRFTGVAAQYGLPVSVGGDMFVEIRPGAFTAAQRDPGRVKVLWQHDRTLPIGHLSKIWDDGDQLMVEAKINPSPDVPEARRFIANFGHGDLSELSVGFEWLKWSRTEDKSRTVYAIDRARLLEVSAVTWGAMRENASVTDMFDDEPSRRAMLAEVARRRAAMHAATH